MARRPASLPNLTAAPGPASAARRIFSPAYVDRVNRVTLTLIGALIAALLAGPALARDSLGIYAGWGAFRDPLVPRCYAIALAEPSRMQRDFQPYASVGTWPGKAVRNQMHFRLSRRVAATAAVTLAVGRERFTLAVGEADAWAADRRMDAAIVAAMRSAASMTVSARDTAGRRFSNTWALEGAASAMDAAALGCARLR